MSNTPLPPQHGRDHSVLLVEDDPSLRRLISLLLKHEGLSVTTAQDGSVALEALRKETFRVMILDLMMPHVSGWDVIAWLKQNPTRRPRSVVVVSAADHDHFAAVDPTVVNAVIMKPFDANELAAYVRACTVTRLERDRRRRRVIART